MKNAVLRAKRGAAAAVLAALVAGGCASTRPPTVQVTEAQSAVKQAEQVGASEYAPLALRNAAQKLEQARAAIERGDNEKARLLAEKAQVDAELAEASALSAKAQEAVKALHDSIRALREEIQKKQ